MRIKKCKPNYEFVAMTGFHLPALVLLFRLFSTYDWRRAIERWVGKWKNNYQISTTNSRLTNGFTLIELLIVVVTMAIVSTVGFANYRGFATRQKLDAVERLVKGDLRLAQQQAVSGKKPTNSVGDVVAECLDDSNPSNDKDLVGYRVEYVSSTEYRVFAQCTGGDVEIKNVDISVYYEDITLSNFGSIQFNVLAKGSSGGSITIEDTDTMESTTIEVKTGGEIN